LLGSAHDQDMVLSVRIEGVRSVDLVLNSFRWGLEHIGDGNEVWAELRSILGGITQNQIERAKLSAFEKWATGETEKSPPVGGQSILNQIIDSALEEKEWETQIYVLGDVYDETTGRKAKLNYWSMDFKKDDIGVEVSFNNAGVLAQNILRLSVMSETTTRPKEELIRVGILVTATNRLKKWSGMDGTVLTFESASKVMPLVNFNIPTPLVLVGLDAAEGGLAWEQNGFFDHKKLSKFGSLSASKQSEWLYQIQDFRDSLSRSDGR
jgi:hypothetical protein